MARALTTPVRSASGAIGEASSSEESDCSSSGISSYGRLSGLSLQMFPGDSGCDSRSRPPVFQLCSTLALWTLLPYATDAGAMGAFSMVVLTDSGDGKVSRGEAELWARGASETTSSGRKGALRWRTLVRMGISLMLQSGEQINGRDWNEAIIYG